MPKKNRDSPKATSNDGRKRTECVASKKKKKSAETPRPELFPDESPPSSTIQNSKNVGKEVLRHAEAGGSHKRRKERKDRDSSGLELAPDTFPHTSNVPKPKKDPLLLAPGNEAGATATRVDEFRNRTPSFGLFEHVAPGAVAVHGVDWDGNDGGVSVAPTTVQQDSTTEGTIRQSSASSRTLNVVATLVENDDDGHQPPLAHATKGRGPWKDKRVRIVLFVVSAVVVVLSVVLGVTLSSTGGAPSPTPGPSTDMPSNAPTSIRWTPVTELVGEAGFEERFGDTVQLSMNGQRLLVSSSGSVHTFDNIDGGWALSTTIPDVMFPSMSADGTMMAVASLDRLQLSMYRFDSSLSGWVTTGPALDALHGTQDRALFGAVKISPDGRRVAVSSRFPSSSDRVSVHGFDESMGWVSLGDSIGNMITRDLEGSGCSSPFIETILTFSQDGSRLVIVDYGDEDCTTGFFRVYDYDAFLNRWDIVGTPQSGAQPDYGVFGRSVAISGVGNVIVFSSQDFFQPGAIYCFRLNATMDWSFAGNLTAGEEDFDVQFVQMTEDGNRIALHNQFGNVRLFQINELQEWVSIANDIITPDEFSSADNYSPGQQKLAMSSDGTLVAIGNSEQSEVRIYELESFTE